MQSVIFNSLGNVIRNSALPVGAGILASGVGVLCTWSFFLALNPNVDRLARVVCLIASPIIMISYLFSPPANAYPLATVIGLAVGIGAFWPLSAIFAGHIPVFPH